MISLQSKLSILLAFLVFSCGPDQAAPVEADSNEDSSPRDQLEALMGGNILTANEVSRSGFLTVGGCTASIVYTSGFRKRTWVITAAHCFGAAGLVSLRSPTGTTLLTGGTVFVSPYYNGTAHDLALVFFPAGLPVLSRSGLTLNEFFRPVWASDPSATSPVPFAGFGTGTNDLPSCDENLPRTNDSTLRWANATFDNTAITGNIGTLDRLNPSVSYFLYGDSGGPWVTASSMTTNNLIDNGVIAGVLSFMHCAFELPSAYEASSTFHPLNHSFILSKMGADLTSVWSKGWTRTCWENWCAYKPAQKAALLASVGF